MPRVQHPAAVNGTVTVDVALEGANVPGGISFTDGIELRVSF
jgi:hypothetical protein